MKNTISSALIAALLIAGGTANAGESHERRANRDNVFFTHAKVTHVETIYRTVRVTTPRQECYTQEVRTNVHDHGNKVASTVIGGLIGAAVGHKVGERGNGKHKNRATVAGALVGAAIGNNVGRKGSDAHQDVSYQEVCETQKSYHEEKRVDGYNVSYRYKGENFTTRMAEHPGNSINIRVHVSPVVH